MKKKIILMMVLAVFVLSGCGSQSGDYPDEIIPAGTKVIVPIDITCDIDELYGNYNVDFDYDSYRNGTINVHFFVNEVYGRSDCENLKPGQAIEFNNGKNRFMVRTIDRVKKVIKGTDLTSECILINNQYLLNEGSNYYTISPKDDDMAVFYRDTEQTATLGFSSDFVFYPENTADTAIYDVDEAITYLMNHPELNHENIDVGVAESEILAIRYVGK